MKKIFIWIVRILALLYIAICVLLYCFQETLIFQPTQLNKSFRFSFDAPFEEMNINAIDGTSISTLLFKATDPKGLIFYLHGNAGSLNDWARIAGTYTSLGYDIIFMDYRGYGKSEGKISGQQQFYSDIQYVYDEMKKRYTEDKIVIIGYSIGTGPAAYTASVNHPRLLILQAPYYSLTDMMQHDFPIIPTFILKYTFSTSEYVQKCKMPIIIFHGTADEVIYYNSSVKLKEKLKPTDTFISLPGQAHNNITDNPTYLSALASILH